MKRSVLLSAALVFSAALAARAAEPNPKELITAAAKKLAEKPNYSWKTTTVVPETARWRPGPVEGRTEKDGQLVKYECKVQGKMDFNGHEVELDRTTTTEIKDVGTTKLDVPEEARKKLI